MVMKKIIHPTLVLDKTICLSNIERMVKKAQSKGLIFRPHFKTHQSQEIGRWFSSLGVDKITVSSLKMAEYFANGRFTDITVAFPINIRAIDTINNLASKVTLNLVLESVEVAQILIDKLLAQVNYYIKIDPGYGRTGVNWDNYSRIESLIGISSNSYALNFMGFLSHAGHSYLARSKKEILEVHNTYLTKLDTLKKKFIQKHPELIVSIGDTPTCSIAEDFQSVDEIRPGNFVFYDATQLQIGSCIPDQIAIALMCPIVAKHKDRNTLIVHGGSVHFSSDHFLDKDGNKIFGLVAEPNQKGWGKILKGAFLKKLSQEHGTVYVPKNEFDNYNVGDTISIIPAHSCIASHLMKEYILFNGDKVDHLEGQF